MTRSWILLPGQRPDTIFRPELPEPGREPILSIPDRGPVADYRLNETGGATSAIDRAQGNTGTIVGAPTQGVAAPPGFADTAMTFDGATQYVTAPNVPGQDTRDSMTVRVWLKTTTAGAFDVLVSRGAWSGVGWFVKVSNEGTAVGWYASGLSITNAGVGGTPFDGGWHQFVGTYDGERLRAYLDGTKYDDWPSTGVIGATTEPLQIARISAQDYFPGSLYGVQVHDRAWTDEEISADWLAGSTAAGNALTADPADTLSLSDSLATASGFGVTIPDTLSLTDAASSAEANAVTIGDTLSLADAATTARGVAASVGDTLALADSATTARGLTAGPADTLTLSDAVVTGQGRTADVADTLTLADSATTTSGIAHSASVPDTLAVSDALAIESGKGATVADTLTLADSISTAHGVAHSSALADTLTLADSATTELVAGAPMQRGTLTVADLALGACTVADLPIGSASVQDAPRGSLALDERLDS